jgi:hypothetical protein
MLKARQGKEIVVRANNEIGALADLSKILAEKGVNVLAMSCWVEEDEAVIRLVTDDILRSIDALKAGGYDPQEKSVVLVEAPHRPGILRHLTDVLSREQIDLTHLFGSATINQDVCLVVLNSTQNERAIVLLND